MNKINKSKSIKFRNNLLRINELGLFVIIIFLSALIYFVNHEFLLLENIINILRSSVIYFIVGCGLTFVLVAGELDISVGSNLGFSGLIVAILLAKGIPIIIAIIIGIFCGISIGYINSFVVSQLKVPPLITTWEHYIFLEVL